MGIAYFVGSEFLLLVAITCVFIGTNGTVFGNATPFVVLVGGITPAGEAVGGIIRKFFFLVKKNYKCDD